MYEFFGIAIPTLIISGMVVLLLNCYVYVRDMMCVKRFLLYYNAVIYFYKKYNTEIITNDGWKKIKFHLYSFLCNKHLIAIYFNNDAKANKAFLRLIDTALMYHDKIFGIKEGIDTYYNQKRVLMLLKSVIED